MAKKKAKKKSPATAKGRKKAAKSAASHKRQISTTGLTDMQAKFVKEYLICLNATKAAKLAGYSEATAHTKGTQLISHDSIRRILAREMNERNKRLEASADRVLLELVSVAFANVGDVTHWKDGILTINDSAKLTRLQMASIRTLDPKYDRKGNPLGVKVQFHDKARFLELLMRHMGMLDPTGRQDTQGTIVDFMKGLRNGE